MISADTIKSTFYWMTKYINEGTYRDISINEYTLHYYGTDIQVLLGFHTLKVCIIDNKNSYNIVFSPVKINEFGINTNIGSTITLFEGDEKKIYEYDTLFIENSVLFQLSLIHNIDISNLGILMYEYAELLENLADSKIKHNTKYIKEAYDNAMKAHVQYSNE